MPSSYTQHTVVISVRFGKKFKYNSKMGDGEKFHFINTFQDVQYACTVGPIIWYGCKKKEKKNWSHFGLSYYVLTF